MKKLLAVAIVIAFGCVSSAEADQVTFTAGIDFTADFWDAQDSPSNVSVIFDLGPNTVITGVGWDVVQTSVGFSWGSEQTFGFGNNEVEVFLNPSATGGPVSGEANFSEVVSFASIGVEDIVLDSDGQLFVELFETFDDVPNSIDGFWAEGSTVTFEFNTVPEPASGLVLLLAATGILSRHRN